MATVISDSNKIKKVDAKKPFDPKVWFSQLRPTQLITHIVLLVLGFFYIFPFLWMLAGSLKSLNGFFAEGLSLIPGEWRWQNYADAWTIAKFGTYFGNTVFITTFVIIFANLFSSMAAYALARTQVPGKKFILGVIVITFLLPKGYTILPIFEIILNLGLNNTLWAVVVVNVAGGLIFNTFLYIGYFNTIHRELEEAARVDGASFARIYWNIIMPLSGPMIATVTLLTFIGNWNDFFTPLVFTLGNPELRTLAVGMFAFVSEHSTDWSLMCAGAAITIVPIIIIFLFLQRYFIEGLAGAVK